jgi:hypothetical protein
VASGCFRPLAIFALHRRFLRHRLDLISGSFRVACCPTVAHRPLLCMESTGLRPCFRLSRKVTCPAGLGAQSRRLGARSADVSLHAKSEWILKRGRCCSRVEQRRRPCSRTTNCWLRIRRAAETYLGRQAGRSQTSVESCLAISSATLILSRDRFLVPVDDRVALATSQLGR